MTNTKALYLSALIKPTHLRLTHPRRNFIITQKRTANRLHPTDLCLREGGTNENRSSERPPG